MRRIEIACAFLVACGGGKAVPLPSVPDAAAVSVPVAPEPPKPRKPKGKPVPDAKPESSGPDGSRKADESELQVEEQEANPNSETVTLRVSISPPAKGVVMWGQKTLARFAPGAMDVELIRPRGSGPLDLEIRADGFLIHHTRVFADRNDRTNVRLYRAEDAVGLSGYKPPATAK